MSPTLETAAVAAAVVTILAPTDVAVEAEMVQMLAATEGCHSVGADSGKHGARKSIILQGLKLVTIKIRIENTTTMLFRVDGSNKLSKHRRY